MELARVIGRVVATVKNEALVGVRLMVIQPVDSQDTPTADPMIAADALQSGPGDLVSWVAGREAALSLPETYTPVDCAVTSIVDHAWSDPERYL
ncbi:MAG: EutN/CcmL family microcompartment protein [Myxococcota bacterium]|nr:EutN/CcmL family microcompartment protein [Myxococcota bacterium]